MKHLPIHRSYHVQLLSEFTYWCRICSYAAATILALESHVRELLHFIEQGGYALDGVGLSYYLIYIDERPNYRLPGGLSTAHVNKQSWALRLFMEYLSMVKGISLAVHIPYLERQGFARKILRKEQIERVQDWIKNTSEEALFDGAILGVFYGLGLRRSEGLCLEVVDISFRKWVVHIRQGKGGKSRVIPLSVGVEKALRAYIYEARLEGSSGHLFISRRGRQMSRSPIEKRLQLWSEVLDLDWRLTLHTLRHSIATQLLASGMDMVLIQQFLGHQSLVSTQLYTHIEDGKI